ncbi:hypothetical protein VitviT2T_026770 [Vitis vinifera]|uniref:Fatty acid desaturase domain-containing protein n=1 Tax=Vitis vinifera TaxID=29760 RepID=A0ABY9DPX0_VITVI|nr:hypothetical protein VitviT2T_026770 [Vitis vinifera]
MICASLYRVLLGNILTNYLLGIISKTSKSRECPKTSENLLMNFQNLGCLRRKAMESCTSIPSLDSCSWCVFMVFCVLRVFGFIWVVPHYWGFLWIQSSYVGHDSGHYQIMSSPGFNKLTQILVENCITGISIAWWKWTHNAHHIACNSLDYESDLQHIPMFTVSSNLFNSIKSIFCGRILKFNYVARFLFQLEHHLFPQLPRCHLRSISSLVKDLCKKHNLPYRGLSLQEANVSTIRTLRTAALQARDLTNLVPKNLVWEAANIHG